MNSQDLPGVAFVPVEFTPAASKFAGQPCRGVNIIVTNRDRFEPVRTGLAVARQLRLLYSEAWKMDNYIRLLGNQNVYNELAGGAPLKQIIGAYQGTLEGFQLRREQYLLY